MIRHRAYALISLPAAVALVAALAAFSPNRPTPAAANKLRFEISFGRSIRPTPVTGRVMVIVSKRAQPEPRLQADQGGVTDTVPFWGEDVSDMVPDQPVELGDGAGVFGYPMTALNQLPPGDYWVQALLNVYTTFHRADGSVVSLHLPCGDGNDLFISPGNLVSTPIRLHLDPSTGGTFDLHLDRALPQLQPVPPGGTCQQGNPADSAHVKHIKIRSELLSAFWGQPMFIAADVLLPQGYSEKANDTVRYPVIWHQTHFPNSNPFGFDEHLGDAFSQWWVSTAAPRVIVVEIRQENPFFDDGYAVNSANLGPYGDAITRELMPAVDKAFRVVDARWARTTTGGSTGGWETAAQQVYYPSLYSGAWIFYPDPVDFHFFQAVDVYNDPNAYDNQHAWLDVARPAARQTSGDTIWAMAQENHWEFALGDHGRSGLGQWDIWQAVYGPEGPDGYPAPMWDKVTGTIDPGVIAGWRAKDLDRYLADNWSTLGPQLTGQLHFFVGTEDTFFLNDAVQLLQQHVATLTGPAAKFTFRYGLNQPHGWSPYSTQQLVTIMAEYMAAHAPHGVATSDWLGAAANAGPQPTVATAAPTRRYRSG